MLLEDRYYSIFHDIQIYTITFRRYFDDAAIKKAHDAHHSIILIDGNKLVDLMHQYDVGVQVRNVYEVKEVDEDFFEVN